MSQDQSERGLILEDTAEEGREVSKNPQELYCFFCEDHTI